MSRRGWTRIPFFFFIVFFLPCYICYDLNVNINSAKKSKAHRIERLAPADTYRRFVVSSVWHVEPCLLSHSLSTHIYTYISPTLSVSFTFFSVRDYSEKTWMRPMEKCEANTRTLMLRPSVPTSWTPSCIVSSSTQPTTSSRSVVLRIFLHAEISFGIDVHSNVLRIIEGRGREFITVATKAISLFGHYIMPYASL